MDYNYKALVQSRVFWSNAIAGMCFLGSFFGWRLPVDQNTAADTAVALSGHVLDVVGIVATIASTWFRATATERINGVLPR